MTVLEPKEQAEILKKSPAEEQIVVLAHNIDLWLSESFGKYALNFKFEGSVGRWDYVALCDGDPGNNPYAYIAGQWQYISNTNSPYVTGTPYAGIGRYWVMYVSWDYGQGAYRVLHKDKKS